LEVWRQAQDAIVGLAGNNMMQGRELDRWGVGYFYYGISDVLLDGLNSLGGSFRDEKGAEAFYTVAVTPWLKATGDIQYVMPVNSARKDAVLVGARMKIEF
jgi:porin